MGTLMHCWWECKLVQPLGKTIWRILKLTVELPYDPAIALLGICPEKDKTLIWKDICTPVFTAALFTIARTWKQPSAHQQMTGLICDKHTCICTYICTHNIYVHTHMHNGMLLCHKKNEILLFTKWMDLENIMLKEISHKKTIISGRCGI